MKKSSCPSSCGAVRNALLHAAEPVKLDQPDWNGGANYESPV
ncbi:MAG: hypothetical protein ACLT8E_08475 [Akkermansia sp.]